MTRKESAEDELRVILARMDERAHEAVLHGTQWLTAFEVEELVQWEAQGLIFAIARDGEHLFPRYALGDDVRPLRVVADILVVLKEYSSEHVASWFESTSKFLGGRRPREIVAKDPQRVLAAARYAIDTERYPS